MAKETIVLCDTNIIIEFYKENASVIRKLRCIGQEHIALSIVTVGELLYGALNKKERKQINQDIAHLHLLHLDSAIGECFINLMNDYALSHSLSLPDGFIAATALVADIPLYTLNRKDFQYISGIQLYS